MSQPFSLSRRHFLESVGASASLSLFSSSPVLGAENPPWWTQGNFAPVRLELFSDHLETIGTIPRSISGLYIRNGSNQKAGDAKHFFTGDGMLHGVRISDGKVDWYRNRWIETPILGKRSKLGMPMPDQNPSNTNVIFHGGRILSLYEAGMPFEVGVNLSTVGSFDYGGDLQRNMTAHPKVDPETGELFGYGMNLFSRPYLNYFVIGPDGHMMLSRNIHMPKSVMMHDLQITKRFAIFFDFPIVFDALALLRGEMPYKWDPELGARIGVMPRYGDADSVRWFPVSLGALFHSVNAFEQTDDPEVIVIEGSRLPQAFANGANASDGEPIYYRWTVHLREGYIEEGPLDDRLTDFSKIDPRFQGRPHSVSFHMSLREPETSDSGMYFSGMIRYERESLRSQQYLFPDGLVPEEMTFVPDRPDAAEGEGWLMGYVYSAAEHSSEFQIFDATELAKGPVARVKLPQRVPSGFHGCFVPS